MAHDDEDVIRFARETVIAAQDRSDLDLSFTNEVSRYVFCEAKIPVPLRLGPGPWKIEIKARTNGMLRIVEPDAFEVTVTYRLCKQR